MKGATKTQVRGDWLPEDHPGYEAEVEPIRWNGWAVPRFTEKVARQIVAEQTAMANSEDQDVLTIVNEDPLTIRHSMPIYADEGEDEYEVITAGTDGLFSIGGWCWCWYENDHYKEA